MAGRGQAGMGEAVWGGAIPGGREWRGKWGGAARSGSGRQRPFISTSRTSKTIVLDILSVAKITSEPNEGIRRAGDERFIGGTKATLWSWLLTNGPMHFYLRKPCTSMIGKSKPVESKTRTYHERFGAGRRTAGRRGRAGAGRDADGSVRQRDHHPVCHPEHRDQLH